MAANVDELYRRYGPMVLRRCQRLLRSEEKALDAMQDTFVLVLRHQSRLTGEGSSSLLFRIATNVCLNKIRGERRRPEDPDDDLLMRIAEAQEGGGANPVARLFLEKVFQRELDSTRTIAVMHLLDGMTLEEVAAEVGLSVSGVRKRLRTLRSRVEELEKDEALEGVSP